MNTPLYIVYVKGLNTFYFSKDKLGVKSVLCFILEGF